MLKKIPANLFFCHHMAVNYISDKRNNKLIPTWGSYINDNRSAIVIADRLGGGITPGNAAFYQSLFLGGQGNLLGYHQYRFAGQYMLYNNFEFRMKLAEFANYILPGQLGLLGFYDIGRVWEKIDLSHQWHNGIGGGFYFAPAQMAVIRITAGYAGKDDHINKDQINNN